MLTPIAFFQNIPHFWAVIKSSQIMATTSTIASLEAEIIRLQHLVDQATDCIKLLTGADGIEFTISFSVHGDPDKSVQFPVATFSGGPSESDLMMSYFMYWGGFYNRQLQHTKRILQHRQLEMPH